VGGGNTHGREGNGLAASGRNHPDAILVLVFLQEASLYGVSHKLSVGAELRVADGANLKIVVDGDGARS